jgi:hypothetical protein
MSGPDTTKSVVLIRSADTVDETERIVRLLDAVSSRQGFWQVADHVVIDPVRKTSALDLREKLHGKLVLLASRRVASAFGFRWAPWLTLQPEGDTVFSVLPSLSASSRWWPHAANPGRARDHFISIVDHFSPRFGQPPGTAADITSPEVINHLTTAQWENWSEDRDLFIHSDGFHIVLHPLRNIALPAGTYKACWAPRVRAPSVSFRVRDTRGGFQTIRSTRGLTAKDLEAALLTEAA